MADIGDIALLDIGLVGDTAPAVVDPEDTAPEDTVPADIALVDTALAGADFEDIGPEDTALGDTAGFAGTAPVGTAGFVGFDSADMTDWDTTLPIQEDRRFIDLDCISCNSFGGHKDHLL